MLKPADIVERANSAWTGRGTLTIAVDGSRCRLVHAQTGKYVAFDLTRADIEGTMDALEKVIAAPMAELRRMVA